LLGYGIYELRVGKKSLLSIWDNASCHESKLFRSLAGEHNQKVGQEAKGDTDRHLLFTEKSRWLDPMKPRWIHGKRKVA
jgi:hypothetical protein